MPPRPCVVVCNGKDCRTRPEHTELERALRNVADVTSVRCLGICHSPVAVIVGHDGNHLVYERVRSPKHRRDLLALVARGEPPSKRLAKRAVIGKARRKVVDRLAKNN